MEPMTRKSIAALAAQRSPHCVSICLPTRRTWPASKQDLLQLRNMIDEAQSELERRGMCSSDARDFLARARELMRDVGFWKDLGDGLVILLDDRSMHIHRMNVPPRPIVFVGDRFMVKPLLAALGQEVEFLILALTEGSDVGLLRCGRDRVERLALPPHPHSVQEAAGFEEPQRGFGFHAAVRTGQGSQHAVVSHALGVRADDSQEILTEYCHALDRRLRAMLRALDLPLVLAGVTRLVAEYRSVNSYAHLLTGSIEGAVERQSDDQLREKGLHIVEDELSAQALQDAVDGFRHAMGRGAASSDPERLVKSAIAGTLSTLFVASDREVWGEVLSGGEVALRRSRQPGDEDLLDRAASEAVRHKTAVWVLPSEDMPDGVAAAGADYYEL